MLVLSRKLNQAIVIGDDVRVVVVSIERDTVKLGIEAPRAISVHRSEIYAEIERAKGEAPEPAATETADSTAIGTADSTATE